MSMSGGVRGPGREAGPTQWAKIPHTTVNMLPAFSSTLF